MSIDLRDSHDVVFLDTGDDPPAPEFPPAARVPARKRRIWPVVRLVVAAGIAGLAVWTVVPMVREARKAQCRQNLAQLARALAQYHEVHGGYPAPSIRGRDGTPMLSWRVAVLPHLGYQSLYDEFHLDEPWDSPRNRPLVAKIPPVFVCPSGGREGRTGYQVVVGPKSDLGSVNTPFAPRRGVDLREITDGTSNTVLVAETDRLVAWTKPDDLRFVEDGPLPHFASGHSGGFHVAFADGSTRFIRSTIEPMILKALLTINGGEVTSLS